MMERFGAWVVEEGTGTDGSKMQVLPVLLLSIMDRERSRCCLDWKNFGNLDKFAVVEGDEESRDLEDIKIKLR
jgi:hypothetical protein